MSDDAELIELTLAGDHAAFGALVQKYQGRLLNTLLHLLGCREEAEDVCQEALVQAFVKLESFGRRSAFYTWLYRIAFNVSVSRRRRRRPQLSLDQQRQDAGEEPAEAAGGPTEEVLRREQVEQVHRAIGCLEGEFRAVLVLRELEGCSYATIGEILALPPGTVRSRLHRARLQLRAELKGILEEKLTE